MENLIDKSKYRRIYAVAFSHSEWLNAIEKDFDEECKLSFILLSVLIKGDDDDLLGRIIDIYTLTKTSYTNSVVHVKQNGQNYAIPAFPYLWSRTCVVAYYFYHNHAIWRDLGGLEKMISLIEFESLTKDVRECISRIDEYFKEENAFKKNIANLPINNDTAEVSSFGIADNNKTNVMKILNYMFDLGMFCGPDGQPLKRQKKHFMIALGKFFNNDFENYAQTINRAAQEEHFTDIFHSMLDLAHKKYIDDN